MKVIDDGVIKYDRSNFTQCGPIDLVEYSNLEYWRKILFKINLIGAYPIIDIGFGNLSEISNYSIYHQTSHPQFVITGTQTGKFPELSGAHYTRVLDYEIDKLKIYMMGPIEASSEALTHAAIYLTNKKIRSIFHIHSPEIWRGMIEDNLPSTAEDIPYGTVEMAKATQACVGNNNSGCFAMLGHVDGVVIYGENNAEVGKLTLALYDKYISEKKL